MWGSVIVQGMLFAAKIRERFPDVPITESHPKALRMASGLNSAAEWLRERSILFETQNDDELDATIAAICAREGFSGNWEKDLASDRFPEEQDPKNQWFGPVYYFWP
jgi:predicted nuclease with RNAse H fold